MGKIKYKVKSKLYLIPIIIIFIVIVGIYYTNYENTVDIIKSEYESKVKLIEQSIYNETKYTEIISEIAERDIYNDMEENSKFLVDKYKTDSDILNWDFESIKNEIDNMDIYILDSELEVIAASLEDEVGLKFDKYTDFSKILQERLKGDKFQSDTINFSIMEGELKKYSYMPTPDNKYLIELSVDIKDAYPELENLNIVYLSKELKNNYPFVEDIRVYKFNKYKKYSHELDTANTKLTKDKEFRSERDEYVKKALETNEPQEQILTNDNNNVHRYKYIPYAVDYKEDKLAWWKSYVIELLYNDEDMLLEISNQKNYLSVVFQ